MYGIFYKAVSKMDYLNLKKGHAFRHDGGEHERI